MKDIIKEFDKEFPFWTTNPKKGGYAILASRDKVKSFILKALAQQKKELLEKIEKLKRDDPWAYGFNVDMTSGYNLALGDIKKQL